MADTPEVAVVGAGIAGLAAGALLSAGGMRVTMFEQSPRPGPVGAGLLLQPTGLAVLEKLGLRSVMEGLGAPVHRLHGRNHRGRVVMDLAYADLTHGTQGGTALHGLGVHRGALFSLLHARALSAGARLTSGARVRGLSALGHRWRLEGDGLGAHEATAFDLVVVADGARSALRGVVCPRARARAYPWGALWFVARDETGSFGGALRQVYRGTDAMVGWLPTGRASQDGPPTVSVFWSVRVKEMDALRRADVGRWRQDVLTLAPELEPLVAQVVTTNDLISAAYMDVNCPMTPLPGVVVLGDASHATSPQLGQGANMALVDALTLAEGLREHPPAAGERGPSEDPEVVDRPREALAGWMSKRRRGSIRFYQTASRWMTPWFQSGMGALAWPRDALMGPMCRVRWVKRQMLLSLAGAKTGLFSSDFGRHK